MLALTWIGRLAVVVLTVGIVLGASAQRAEACTCLPPTVESSYNGSSDVVRARIVSRTQSSTTTRYIARVQRVFKGCLEQGQLIVLTTPSSSAACGALLSTNRDYLINGDAAGTLLGLPRLNITLCDYNQPWALLTQHDRDFLDGRMVCCGDECQCADGTAPVNCFVDPCEVAPECPDGKCVASYCGGCNAEFYDESGYAVCEAECSSADDCMVTGCSGQVCAAEPVFTTCEWRPEYACYQDPELTTCGCSAGRCAWDDTPKLAACIEAGGP